MDERILKIGYRLTLSKVGGKSWLAYFFLDTVLLPISWLSIPQRLNFYSLDSKSNLTRYTTPHLTPLTLLTTLASSLMNTLPFPTKFQPFLLLPYQTASLYPSLPWLQHSIATSIVHSKLDYCNFLSTTTYLSLRLPASNWFRTLSPVQLLKLLNPVTSLLSYALFTGSK